MEQKVSFELPKSGAVNIYMKYADYDGRTVLFTFEDAESGEKKELTFSPTNNGWISVKDRLPEEGKRVLCCLSYGEIVIAWYNDISQMWYEVGKTRTFTNISHWQPIPKPPRED